jgi:hypothetical protein
MSRRRGLGRWRRLTAIAFALYAIVLVTSEFEHHDLACHFKTPQHCSACNASPLSHAPNAPMAMVTCRLADAGRAYAANALLEGSDPITPWSGRSPPARS